MTAPGNHGEGDADREQVQMVAGNPRCCVETNKPAKIELGSILVLQSGPSKGWGYAVTKQAGWYCHKPSTAKGGFSSGVWISEEP